VVSIPAVVIECVLPDRHAPPLAHVNLSQELRGWSSRNGELETRKHQRHVYPHALRADSERYANIRQLLGPSVHVVDLAEDPETDGDIARYVRAALLEGPRSRHRSANPAVVEQIARAVADQAAVDRLTV
jgi:hypothetical protein